LTPPGHPGGPIQPLLTGRLGMRRRQDQFAGLLPIRERMYGPTTPTPGCGEELALTARRGRAAARDQFATLLSAYEEVLPEHRKPTVCTSCPLTALGGDEATRTSSRLHWPRG
jgi:hypothetical protein